MTRKIILILLFFSLNSNCSFDTKSGIWTNNEKLNKVANKDTILFEEKKRKKTEFNKNFIIKTPLVISSNTKIYETNNSGIVSINNEFQKKSKYKFSKIKYFEYFDPELIFDRDNLIFLIKKVH